MSGDRWLGSKLLSSSRKIVSFEVVKARLSGDRWRLGTKAVKMPIRFHGGGSDPGPLSSPTRPKGASARLNFGYYLGMLQKCTLARTNHRSNCSGFGLRLDMWALNVLQVFSVRPEGGCVRLSDHDMLCVARRPGSSDTPPVEDPHGGAPSGSSSRRTCTTNTADAGTDLEKSTGTELFRVQDQD
ncbi:hypothetical protein THAOC_16046 [Thalassiosira oceanica]|uniref:Uncharacterized protein n=1 Tax=Thalassiosira oceanica TaxID=159749 RepID=K0SD72_THAOC|nr:hypothetical protein THAOC_16046 [Thalassiosira oceanica]|eukprot:EJK63305.1 hypothetical protein THAOC_16046 [Thalassiosira oceanica]